MLKNPIVKVLSYVIVFGAGFLIANGFSSLSDIVLASLYKLVYENQVAVLSERNSDLMTVALLYDAERKQCKVLVEEQNKLIVQALEAQNGQKVH